ncbi:MAG: signal recognition particle-docking protein FtsY [Rhodothermaceae bacterium]|nr:signal recognition particle-docking protein FtsY [Rhodothermaceae bacterium]MXX59219.1 signal recognition particle-docking protein FtsY [Rhodothermaceae bacterium]MYD18121.1 signal recognition particle-docking protein FtsY [Rhodothermaceae bacterium]MYD57265.1 signal recognition particle-docking protein FtsY [Rhodothermaceae bacterium]MYI42869.1 signal recognition particle-docking protein FtsY [Rhodothermaceae bacterium]
MKLFRRRQAEDQDRLESGLEKTREGIFGKIGRLVKGKRTIDDALLDDIEEALVTSDVGINTTLDIIERIKKRAARDRYLSSEELQTLINDEIALLLEENPSARPADFDAPLNNQPHVIMVVGVNGVGKTTTIGKLAWRYAHAGRSVLIGAGDTFRAAAIEQLETWAERAGVDIVKQQHGADPAAVAFDTVQSAVRRSADVAIIDTAGRLHTKTGLMNELSKIKRVMGRQVRDAPHEVLLVLDATIGQNALRQAEEFTRSVDVTGLVVTKLDGSAKGGIVIGISNEFKVPVKYIGVGESLEDLQVFDRQRFVKALSVA